MALEGPKWLVMGSKWAHSRIFGKTHFWPIFAQLLVPKHPIFKAFCDFGGATMACNGLKSGSFHMFRHRKWSGIIFRKNTFLTHFLHILSQNSPFSRHFASLGGPKRATTSSTRPNTTYFGIPCGRGSFLQKSCFGTRWTLLTHFGTHLFGRRPTACRSPLGLGTRV